MKLQFGFVIFWCKNIGKKSARKMLMKLTLGVKFISIFHATFLYETALHSFSLIMFWLCDFFGKGYRRKSCS